MTNYADQPQSATAMLKHH